VVETSTAPPEIVYAFNRPSLSILHALELEDKEKIVIWDLFVENMHDL
jgi:hypothetical protein